MSLHSGSLDTASIIAGVIASASGCGPGSLHFDVQSSLSPSAVSAESRDGACLSGGRFAHGSRVSARHGGCSWLNRRALYAGSEFAVS